MFHGILIRTPRVFKDFCYLPNHFLIGDKGYSYIRKRNFTLITPKRPGKEGKI